MWPGVAFALAFSLILALDLDRSLAHALFFDVASRRWLGESAADTDLGWLVRATGAAVLGATGYALGAVAKHIHRERWERVPLPTRVSISASPSGVFALSYSF